MASHIFQQLRTAVRHLNPSEVRQMAARPVTVGLAAASDEAFDFMRDFFVPPGVSPARRRELRGVLYRIGDPGTPSRYDVEIVMEGLPAGPGVFTFAADQPERVVRDIVEQREDLRLALARRLAPFRKATINRVIHDVAWENALFALLTALPDAVPSLFELGWAVGEFASDTTVLTVNQIRMAFLIAAASDKPAGYGEQKAQIGSIIAGAFGWRALARELVGKIPFGGGLIPKAAVAFAGTYVAGLGLERYHRIGYGLSRAERRAAYYEAFERGRDAARALIESVRARNAV